MQVTSHAGMSIMEQAATTYVSKRSAHIVTEPERVRKPERFRLKKGFVACTSTNFCEIVDISNTGLALQYLAHQGSDCERISEINILNNLEGFLLGQIPCQIAYVNDIVPSGQYGQTVTRRIGLQFMNLSPDQQGRIDELLLKFSTEKVNIQ